MLLSENVLAKLIDWWYKMKNEIKEQVCIRIVCKTEFQFVELQNLKEKIAYWLTHTHKKSVKM